MGFNDLYSQKKVNISKTIFEDEKKIHKGTGTNSKCTNNDVAKIMGLSDNNRSNFSNYHYCFPIDSVLLLCKEWGIRPEYLCGIDSYRTIDDIFINEKKENVIQIKKSIIFCELLGYTVSLTTRNNNNLLKIESISNDNLDSASLPLIRIKLYKNNKQIANFNALDLANTITTLLDNDNNILDLLILKNHAWNNL